MKKLRNRKILSFVIIIITGFFLGLEFSNYKKSTTTEITYNEFIKKVEKKEISQIELDLKQGNKIIAIDNNKKKYLTDNPKYENFKLDMLKENIEVKEFVTNNTLSILYTIISMMTPFLIVGAMIYVLKAQTKSNVTNNPIVEKPEKTFKDIAGLTQVKNDMELLVEFLKNPNKFTQKGAKLPKGVILYGEPGTGKTLLAKAVAGEANVPFFSVSGSNFIEMFVGVGAKRVRELFEQARKNSPCIIFIDEIDAVGGKRSGDVGNSEQRQTINSLLAEMDGFNNSDGVLVICATNRIEDLDSALIRPGRFDKHIKVSLPETPKERMEIIDIYSKNKSFDEDVDFYALAKETIGFSPADIEALINEATLISIQDDKPKIDRESIDKAIYKKLLKGHAKDTNDRDENEMKLVAWHEAGHAVVGKLFDMDISKVTITPSTSGAGGVNIIIPKKMGLYSIEEMEANIKMSYGGRVAEYLLLKDKRKVTTGASNDIKQATNSIYQMISYYGMTDKFGMLNLEELEVDNKVILDEAISIASKLEIETIGLLTENKEMLEAVVEALLENETISGRELDDIYNRFNKLKSIEKEGA